MLAWMAYVTAVGLAAGAAGVLAERALRHLGRPVRGVWVGVMAVTVGVPALRAVAGWIRGAAVVGVDAGGDAAAWAGLDPLSSPVADRWLVLGWGVVTLVLLANVRLAGWTVRRNERSWRRGEAGGGAVLVSTSFGPGVVGALRPRIVMPAWVLGAESSLRQLVMLHEVEHVRARDTRLLLGGVVLVSLVPWCLPLWWHLERLRSAIETDCDARVLGSADVRSYANALVAVAGRGRRGTLPVPALAPRRRELERRIDLITGGRRRSTRAGLAWGAAALGVALAAGGAPAPELPDLRLRGTPSPPAPYRYFRAAELVLTVEEGPAGQNGPGAGEVDGRTESVRAGPGGADAPRD